MNKFRITRLLLLSFFFCFAAQASIPARAGWWKFDDTTNLTKAEAGFGSDLIPSGTIKSAAGPESGNLAVLAGIGSYLKMQHSILPNGAGIKVNEYTLQFDFKISSNTFWHSFFQTNLSNSDDGDFFINTSGNIGVAAVGYSSYAVKPNDWYRLIISVKNGSFFNCYLDGNLLFSGNTQTRDGRFSLSDQLFIFADNDQEDAEIICSELAIWGGALNAEQAGELGGFGHKTQTMLMTRIPFLQGQGKNVMNVCWHDTAKTGTQVEYGLDSTLTQSTTGTSETINEPYRWHSVKLSGLSANTRYFYRVSSGNGSSGVYSFKTLPDDNYSGILRFLLFSDTHSSDTTTSGKVIRAAREKITELYGPNPENQVNGIFHSGDLVVSGNSVSQYSTQFFQPISALSSNIPTMAVAGNHEGESPYFYQYLKLEDQSAFPFGNILNEKIWQLKIGNSLFIGLNTNITAQYGTVQANWLKSKLSETEQDSTVDFVFLFFHHPPFSELWFDVSTFDDGANYVKNVLFPIIKKFTKVQQINTGHTHGFERGTIQSDQTNSDFRIICGGGGGGPLDSWGAFTNFDYPDIQIAIDHYCFQILEIDVASHSYQNSMYSLGTLDKPGNAERMDSWYKKINQPGPETPVAANPVITENSIRFSSSEFSGTDSIMSVQLQVTEASENSNVKLDTLVHRTNIYGVDENFEPVDKNLNVNLYRIVVRKSEFTANKTYEYRVRYRDQNLKWSNWSNSVSFNSELVNANVWMNESQQEYFISQNYPNPFSLKTTIDYQIPETTEVILRITDENNRLIREINEGTKNKGNYQISIQADQLNCGICIYQLITRKKTITKKMVIIN